jgi:gliding motility-associated-like protein
MIKLIFNSMHSRFYLFLWAIILNIFFGGPLSINAQNLTISGDNGFCPNGLARLIAADSFRTYAWSTGEMTRSITVTTAGNYTVIATDSTGKMDTVSKFIRAFQNPQPTFGGAPFICPKRSTTVFVEQNCRKYQWSNGDTIAQLNTSSVGSFSVTITDFNGCIGSGSVTIADGSTAALSLPDSIKICAGDSALLDATGQNATSYYWNTDDTTATLTVRSAGIYNVIVSNGQCVSYDTTRVFVLPAPVFNLGRDTIICQKDTLILRGPTSPLYAFVWQDSSREQTFAATKTGIYHLNVSFGKCRSGDSMSLHVFNEYQGGTKDTVSCDTVLKIIPNFYGATSYKWAEGSQDTSLTVSKSGTYQVIAFNGRCYLDRRFNVVFKKKYPLELGRDTVLCRDLGQNAFFISAELPNTKTYFWNDTTREPTRFIKESGLYWVQATNECGDVRDSINVVFHNCYQQFVPNVFSPNGDGANDFLQIYPSFDVVKIVQFNIFDRWGNRVFSAQDFSPDAAAGFAWNGYFGGRLLPPDVFVYYLEIETKTKERLIQKGDITLIR